MLKQTEIKCVFTCSIFVDQTQKDFECFSCFWKVFCFFAKLSKFSKKKQCCPVLATQSRVDPVACPSHESLQKIFATHWRVNVPVMKNTQNIFQNLGFYCFSQLSLATCSRLEVLVATVLRDFHNLRHDFLAGRTSSRKKHLENFSNFCL